MPPSNDTFCSKDVNVRVVTSEDTRSMLYQRRCRWKPRVRTRSRGYRIGRRPEGGRRRDKRCGPNQRFNRNRNRNRYSQSQNDNCFFDNCLFSCRFSRLLRFVGSSHKRSCCNQDTGMQSASEYCDSYCKDGYPLSSSKIYHVGTWFH